MNKGQDYPDQRYLGWICTKTFGLFDVTLNISMVLKPPCLLYYFICVLVENPGLSRLYERNFINS